LRVVVVNSIKYTLEDGRYYTPTYQHARFAGVWPHLEGLDAVVMTAPPPAPAGSRQAWAYAQRVFGLPYCADGVDLYIRKLPRWALKSLKLMWLNRRRWDVVLLVDPNIVSQLFFVLAKLLGKPVVILHAGRHDLNLANLQLGAALPRRLAARAFAAWVRLASRLISAGSLVVVEGEPEFYLPLTGRRRPAVIMSTSVSADQIEPELPARRLERSRGALLVLSVGRVAPGKRYEDLIAALAQVRRQGLEVELDIAGPLYGPGYGGYEQKLRAQIEQLGLGDQVRLLGEVEHDDQLMKLYRRADILALSSKAEGVPLVFIEAMAKGLPILSARVGGLTALVEDGVTGLLVPPGDVETLAGGLTRLAQDPQLRLAMGNEAVARAGQLTIEYQGECLAGLIKRAAGERG
jgi:glycosyltransferase involved in cell wall biosynthesis